jgi:hypothetical protein
MRAQYKIVHSKINICRKISFKLIQKKKDDIISLIDKERNYKNSSIDSNEEE